MCKVECILLVFLFFFLGSVSKIKIDIYCKEPV
jgi:hypothetical protein